MGPILPPAPVATLLSAAGGGGHSRSRRPLRRRTGGQQPAGGLRAGVIRVGLACVSGGDGAGPTARPRHSISRLLPSTRRRPRAATKLETADLPGTQPPRYDGGVPSHETNRHEQQPDTLSPRMADRMAENAGRRPGAGPVQERPRRRRPALDERRHEPPDSRVPPARRRERDRVEHPRTQAEPLPCISARMWSVPWEAPRRARPTTGPRRRSRRTSPRAASRTRGRRCFRAWTVRGG